MAPENISSARIIIQFRWASVVCGLASVTVPSGKRTISSIYSASAQHVTGKILWVSREESESLYAPIEVFGGPWYRSRMAKDGGFQKFWLPLNPEHLLGMRNLKCIKVFLTLDAFLLERLLTVAAAAEGKNRLNLKRDPIDYGAWSGRCVQLTASKGCPNPILPMVGAACNILAPNVGWKAVEIPDGASCFVFDPFCKVEFRGKFILDKLPSGQVIRYSLISLTPAPSSEFLRSICTAWGCQQRVFRNKIARGRMPIPVSPTIYTRATRIACATASSVAIL